MADHIYTMETRLAPDQMRAVNLVQDIARELGMNIYLTGGAIRDILTGFPIRDLDFTVQGSALRMQRDLEKAGGKVDMVDEELRALHVVLPGSVRAEITMARQETFDKPGKPPRIAPATITEDLRRRDFTVNAMALSLNEGSRGLLLDPANGSADIESKTIRILHNYAFLEEPSRLIRAARFMARFHWELEERTKARYEAAKEGNYIEYLNKAAIGYEIEQIAHEADPLTVMRALEREGWLKLLHPRWSVSKVDTPELQHLMKTQQHMSDLGINVDSSAAVMYFITYRLGEKEIGDIQRMIPHRELVTAWKRLEDDAKDLQKKLQGKEANLPSGAWKILTECKPEALLFLDVTVRAAGAAAKIRNFFGKWRQMRGKLPLPEMAQMRITPQLAEYPKIMDEAFLLLIDGRLRGKGEIMRFLKPYEPPPPPPPPAPPPRRGRKAEPIGKKPPKKTEAAAPAGAQPAKAAGKIPQVQAVAAAGAKTPPAAKTPAPAPPAKAAKKPIAAKAGKPKPVTKAKPLKKVTKPKPKPPKKKAAKVKSKSKPMPTKKRAKPAAKKNKKKR